MSTPQAFLTAWAAVTQDLGRLVDVALDVEPPGGLPSQWKAVLSRWGVTPMSEADRFEAVGAMRQGQGAPVPEVVACLDAFVVLSRQGLAPVMRPLSPEQAKVVTTSLGLLRDEAERRFREGVAPKKRGMFSHAKKLAAEHRSQAWAGTPHGYVLTCTSCGGPRLEEKLACAFCGGDLA